MSRWTRLLTVLLAFAVVALIFTLWPVPDRPVVTGAQVVSDDTSDTSALALEPPAAEADDEQDLDVRALITPTGVVVPVVAELADEYVVTSPCGNPARVRWGRPIRSIDIVLDPGHGGEVETGAVGPNLLAEKDLNLEIAKRTARELESRGITVLLTRTADYRMPLAQRAEIANRLAAEAIISIHHNAPNANPSETPGTEVFYPLGSEPSRRLAGLVYEEVEDALSQFDVAWTTATDAGALNVLNASGEDSYGMIRRPRVPAVLAELGYLSNPQEADLFATEAYREEASLALAEAIERWLETDDPGSGFVASARIFTPNGSTGGSDGCVDPELG